MAGQQLGVVAAGHPRTARAGADVLRDGGNAVDAALAAMAVSFACEPLLTGLGAGGYMLVVAPDGSQTLLDFFVEAPGPRHRPARRTASSSRSTCRSATRSRCSTSAQASVGTYGVPAGLCEAAARFGARAARRPRRRPARGSRARASS